MERSFPKLNGDTLFVRIRRELELQRSFEVHQLKEKRSLLRTIRGRAPGVAQRAAIFCCYSYPDRLGLYGRSYEEEACQLEKERAS